MKVDKNYCMNSYLMFRTIADRSKSFSNLVKPRFFNQDYERSIVKDSHELERNLRNQVENSVKEGGAALALSGGIDSAILAKFMPKGSVAYTFKCVVPGVNVVDETPTASSYAKECGLEHRVIEITWHDFENFLEIVMKRKGAPVHSIEVQIFKLALQAKSEGHTKLIFGETADCLYGGLDGLLSKDFNLEEIVERYSYVNPSETLKDSQVVIEPYLKHYNGHTFDMVGFLQSFFFNESMGSYTNACDSAGIEFVAPFSKTEPDNLDLQKIRNGKPKYLVREVFERLYPGFKTPRKLPMPRATNEWFKDWKGPSRPEFIPDCINGMSGDQKWLIYCLEEFLNMLDAKKI